MQSKHRNSRTPLLPSCVLWPDEHGWGYSAQLQLMECEGPNLQCYKAGFLSVHTPTTKGFTVHKKIWMQMNLSYWPKSLPYTAILAANIFYKAHEASLLYILFKNLFHYYLVAWVCICTACMSSALKVGRSIRSPGTGIVDNCEPPCKCWDSNPGPLQAQPVILTDRPLFSPTDIIQMITWSFVFFTQETHYLQFVWRHER